jgi:hypothetical protein
LQHQVVKKAWYSHRTTRIERLQHQVMKKAWYSHHTTRIILIRMYKALTLPVSISQVLRWRNLEQREVFLHPIWCRPSSLHWRIVCLCTGQGHLVSTAEDVWTRFGWRLFPGHKLCDHDSYSGQPYHQVQEEGTIDESQVSKVCAYPGSSTFSLIFKCSPSMILNALHHPITA